MRVTEDIIMFAQSIEPHYYFFAAIVLLAAVTVYLMVLTAQMKSLNKKYSTLVRGSDKKNILEVFEKYSNDMEDDIEMKESLDKELSELKDQQNKSLHHIGLVRYSAYEDVGSDLSFSVALLDGDFNGVLITSIFGRNESHTYAKPISRAESEYRITPEEQEAIRRASLPRALSRRYNKKKK